ncbi:MAG TPA: HD domain-containing phosphohydrolase [Planctomycetaceae bacterium]|jgi:HD-GYP domain-containing protein (c-di-GMP phosphodiesterase class II)|nr:HD domain-containing phosphohydrolase [Planctomycetaceae bacterium]
MTTSLLSKRSREFVPVRVASSIPVLRDFRWSMYLRNAVTERFRLYRAGGTELKTSDLRRLSDAGITTVYLDASDYSGFQDQLRASLKQVVSDERFPLAQRFSVVNEVVRGVLRETFCRGNVDRAVEQTIELADHVVDLVCRDDLIASELQSVLHFDYSTFTHSANVAYYTVMLAHALGHSDRAILTRIGTGALLHDIGKLGIPEPILSKPGRLSPVEWNVLRNHPALGLMSLKNQDPLEFGQLMMVYQHHERIDGSGYPVRLAGNDIHEWARICAVVDVFEALTSDRPYRRPLSTVAALETIEQTDGRRLEPEYLQCWKTTISRT